MSAEGSTWSFSFLHPLRVLFKNWTKILLALADHPARSWLRSLGFDISTEMDLQPPTLLSSALTSSCFAPWDPRITGLMELVPSLGLHMLSLGVLASLFLLSLGKTSAELLWGKKKPTSAGFLQFSGFKATVRNQLWGGCCGLLPHPGSLGISFSSGCEYSKKPLRCCCLHYFGLFALLWVIYTAFWIIFALLVDSQVQAPLGTRPFANRGPDPGQRLSR